MAGKERVKKGKRKRERYGETSKKEEKGMRNGKLNERRKVERR